ncbi:MAG: Error-prone repair protein ImuA [Bacteroidota bacterium]
MASAAIIEQLQKQILSLQGGRPCCDQPALPLGLGVMESAFPGGAFPKGAVHEFISVSSEEAACTTSFISVVLGKLMKQGGHCMWISTVPRRSVFPHALGIFGLAADRILFVDAATTKETLWALEEALKCGALVAVVGELNELSFNDSRRLQLAVEQSRVTGFIHRFRPKVQSPVACITRWKISPLASEAPDGLPGLGFPRWQLALLKVRSGQPAQWQVEWSPKSMSLAYIQLPAISGHERQTG